MLTSLDCRKLHISASIFVVRYDSFYKFSTTQTTYRSWRAGRLFFCWDLWVLESADMQRLELLEVGLCHVPGISIFSVITKFWNFSTCHQWKMTVCKHSILLGYSVAYCVSPFEHPTLQVVSLTPGFGSLLCLAGCTSRKKKLCSSGQGLPVCVLYPCARLQTDIGALNSAGWDTSCTTNWKLAQQAYVPERMRPTAQHIPRGVDLTPGWTPYK